MSAKRAKAIEETIILLADRGLDDPALVQQYSPGEIIDACEDWAKRVGILSRGSAAVSIATGTRYPGLFQRLLPVVPS